MGNFAGGDKDYIQKLNDLQDAQLIWSTKTSSFSAVVSNGYFITGNSVVATLPSSPTIGKRCVFASQYNGVTGFSLGRNSSNINGAASDYTPTGNLFWLECQYRDSTTGWQIKDLLASQVTQLEVKTTAFSAVAGKTYIINGSSFTVTLPTPSAGDVIRFVAAKNDKTAITFDPTASYKIRSGTNGATWVCNGQDWDIWFCYVDGTIGWEIKITKGSYKSAPSISTNTLTLDLEGGLWPDRIFEVSLNANITTFTVNNYPASGMPYFWEVVWTADGTQRTITYPTAWKFAQSLTPIPTLTNGKKDRIGCETYDGGTAVYCGNMGQAY